MVETVSRAIEIHSLALTLDAARLDFITSEPLMCAIITIFNRALVERQVFVRNLKVSARFLLWQLLVQFDQLLLLEICHKLRFQVVKLFLPTTVLQLEDLGPFLEFFI